jgi:hypothetical protein
METHFILVSNLCNSRLETIEETTDAKGTVSVIADVQDRQTTEVIVVEKAMSMPTLLAEPTEIVSARTDTQAVIDDLNANGTETEARLDVMPAVTTTPDPTDETAIHTMIAVVEDETVARMGPQDRRAAVAHRLHQRSESLPPT